MAGVADSKCTTTGTHEIQNVLLPHIIARYRVVSGMTAREEELLHRIKSCRRQVLLKGRKRIVFDGTEQQTSMLTSGG